MTEEEIAAQAAADEAARLASEAIEVPLMGDPLPPQEDNTWHTKLAEVSGGRFNKPEDLQAHLAEDTGVRQRLSDYESRFDKIPPLLKKQLELIEKGATDLEIEHFTQLQSVKLEGISDREILKQYHKIKEPFAFTEGGKFSEAALNEMVADEYPETTEGMTAKERYDYNIKVNNAKTFIQSQLIAAQNPQSIAERDAATKAKEQKIQDYSVAFDSNYTELVRQGLGAELKMDIEDTAFDSIEGNRVSIAFKPSQEQREAILKLAKTQLLTLGIDPKDTNQINSMVKAFKYVVCGDDIVAAAVKQAVARATQAKVKELTGGKVDHKIDNKPPPKATSWYDNFGPQA